MKLFLLTDRPKEFMKALFLLTEVLESTSGKAPIQETGGTAPERPSKKTEHLYELLKIMTDRKLRNTKTIVATSQKVTRRTWQSGNTWARGKYSHLCRIPMCTAVYALD